MFGLYPKFKPRMAKVFGNAGEIIENGVRQYVREVQNRSFPGPENFFHIKDEEYEELIRMLD
jgi:3-methyl-2-oxobutanoate hydroxymethyltransferase